MKDNIEEFFSRIRSPFFLTFIFVWAYCNYDLLVILFNLQTYGTVDEMVKPIGRYLSNNSNIGWHLTFRPFLISILSLILYYSGSALGLIIKEFYSMRLKPGILHMIKKYAKTTSNDTVDMLDRSLKEAREKIKIAYENVLKSESDLRDANSELNTKTIALDKLTTSHTYYQAVNKKLEDEKLQLRVSLDTSNELVKTMKPSYDELTAFKAEFNILNLNPISLSRILTDGVWEIKYDNIANPNYWTVHMGDAKDGEAVIEIKNAYSLTTNFYQFDADSEISDRILNFQLIRIDSNTLVGFDRSNKTGVTFKKQ